MSKLNLLQAMLDEYAADGEWDSTGQFSIDSARALEVLARHQSSNPDLFLLHWVRFATLCGASHTRIALEENQLFLRHDGHWPELLSWHELWGHEKGPERALAFCLWNALRFRFGEARLWQKHCCLRLQSDLKGEEYNPEVSTGNFLSLALAPQARSNDPSKPGMKPLGEDQRPLLITRCGFSPLEIHYLGQVIPSAPRVPCTLHGLFQGGLQEFPMQPPETGDEPRYLSVPDAYCAHVYLGVRDGRDGLSIVLDGVSYPAPVPWGLPRLMIVLAAEGMRLDLSGERLVHTRAYEALSEWLVRDLDHFFRGLISDIDHAPAGLVPYLEALISVRLKADDFKSAYEICRWVYVKTTARRMEFFNDWQKASFLYRFAIVSVMMRDKEGARHLREQAEQTWLEAPEKETKWLPKAEVPDGKLTQAEKIDFCRMAVEEQTAVDGMDRVRRVLLHKAGEYEQGKRWNLVAYCQRWLLEIEHAKGSKVARKDLAIRQALLGVSMIRHLRQKATPMSHDWYEAQVYLSQALVGWRTQLERQNAIAEEDRATLLDIIDAHVHIHLALGQTAGARGMLEVWLDEQRSVPDSHLELCLEHIQRLRAMLGPGEAELAANLDRRAKRIRATMKGQQPAKPLDLFSRFFRR